MTRFLAKFVAFLGSYAFICILLIFLFIITLVGTLEQVDKGLFVAQKQYFDSFYSVYHLGPVPVLLPGGYLLMMLMATSLVIGGLIRMRKSWSLLGVFIAHIGIAMLLLAGWVKQQWSREGVMSIDEGATEAEFQAYHDWEIVVAEVRPDVDSVTELQIDGQDFLDLNPGAQRIFHHDTLPFDLAVSEVFTNCRARPESARRGPDDGHIQDGYFLQAVPRDPEAERNIAGVYIAVLEKGTGQRTDHILFGAEVAPLPLVVDGRQWAIDLRKRRESIPFAVQLDEFTVEMHPGTGMASTFASDVQVIEPGFAPRKVHISMNEPLRHEGYTLYQTNWGPQDKPADWPEQWSVLAVVKNPSDQWPLYSCIVITIGLLLHFLMKLNRYVKHQSSRRSA